MSSDAGCSGSAPRDATALTLPGAAGPEDFNNALSYWLDSFNDHWEVHAGGEPGTSGQQVDVYLYKPEFLGGSDISEWRGRGGRLGMCVVL